MTEELVTDAVLREFLLGKLADEDYERIEGLFLTDPRIRERVLALEQDLIDDYLEDSLSLEEKAIFLSHYAQTDEQRRKLRISGAIKDWAVRERRVPDPTAPAVSVWNRFSPRLKLKPRFVVPIAVVLVIVIVVAIVWLNSRIEQRKHLAIEQELAQLNSPASLREVPPQMVLFNLRAVSVRSGEPQAELKIPAETRFIELQLSWIQNERYPMYQAELRRVGDRESFTISNLQAKNDGPYTIRLRLRAWMLSRGNYQINLTGIAANGSASFSQEYSFVVAN